jgi:hypothetical protein
MLQSLPRYIIVHRNITIHQEHTHSFAHLWQCKLNLLGIFFLASHTCRVCLSCLWSLHIFFVCHNAEVWW